MIRLPCQRKIQRWNLALPEKQRIISNQGTHAVANQAPTHGGHQNGCRTDGGQNEETAFATIGVDFQEIVPHVSHATVAAAAASSGKSPASGRNVVVWRIVSNSWSFL
eukprot:scaffold9351_cov55-Attheya_sp.AAC.1